MRFKWDAEADARLLLAVMKVLNPTVSKENWDRISEEMGDGLTGNAVQIHIIRLKQRSSGGSSVSPKKNPVKLETEGTKCIVEETPTRNRNSSRKRTFKSYVEPDFSGSESTTAESAARESPTKKAKPGKHGGDAENVHNAD